MMLKMRLVWLSLVRERMRRISTSSAGHTLVMRPTVQDTAPGIRIILSAEQRYRDQHQRGILIVVPWIQGVVTDKCCSFAKIRSNMIIINLIIPFTINPSCYGCEDHDSLALIFIYICSRLQLLECFLFFKLIVMLQTNQDETHNSPASPPWI